MIRVRFVDGDGTDTEEFEGVDDYRQEDDGSLDIVDDEGTTIATFASGVWIYVQSMSEYE